MNRRNAIDAAITTAFPDAASARMLLLRISGTLEERWGMSPANTRFAEGGCCDEIGEDELELLEHYWGERFKFGGLAGYCHAGKSGLAAVSHHVPEQGTNRNLLLVAGPHIGYHQGQWGKALRKGHSKPTNSCGSLAAVLARGLDAIRNAPADPLDLQQQTVERIMLPYLERCCDRGAVPDMVGAVKHMMARVDRDLFTIVRGLHPEFGGAIAVVTGITVNTESGSLLSPSKLIVIEADGTETPLVA